MEDSVFHREPDGSSPRGCDRLCSHKTKSIPSKCPKLFSGLESIFNINSMPANSTEAAVPASPPFVCWENPDSMRRNQEKRDTVGEAPVT